MMLTRYIKTLVFGAAVMAAPFLFAQTPEDAAGAAVVILGEYHDNPEHHRLQAEWVRALTPKAVVWEMLTPAEARLLNGTDRSEVDLRVAMQDFHWSNIADYIPIMVASDADFVGAAQDPGRVRAAFSDGSAQVFGDLAETYGLTKDLPDEVLEVRKQLQFEAHCEAMPLEMMGGMVEAQRFRDAAFAHAVLEALDQFGAPVVLITGNGHARKDWGVPVYLARARPTVTVYALGQGEETSALGGSYDSVLSAPPPERADPCSAFR